MICIIWKVAHISDVKQRPQHGILWNSVWEILQSKIYVYQLQLITFSYCSSDSNNLTATSLQRIYTKLININFETYSTQTIS